MSQSHSSMRVCPLLKLTRFQEILEPRNRVNFRISCKLQCPDSKPTYNVLPFELSAASGQFCKRRTEPRCTLLVMTEDQSCEDGPTA